MAIFRGVGGSGDSSDNSFLQEVTGQANAASASATSAANSLAAIQQTEVTSASFDTGNGVLTLTKTGGATVTTDLDGRFLTSYTETNNLSSAVTWANVPDANITQSSVTQHQAALSITESQISNLQSYLTTHQDITGKANLSGATFTGLIQADGGLLIPETARLEIGDNSFGGNNTYLSTNASGIATLEAYNNLTINSTSNVTLSGNGNVPLVRGVQSSGQYAVSLYHGTGQEKLKTTSDGVDVTGELTVTGNAEAELFKGDLEGAVHFKGAVASGATLTKGDVVYVSGHSGQKTEVDLADASDSNKMPAFGIVAADPVGVNVDVVTFGTLKSINTSTYTDGDELYVDTTAGGLTATAPSGEGNLVQKIAKVVRASNSGNIKVMGAGRTNATPNLNDGNIFIGDSNNVATTASFTTEVANATTGKADLSGATFTGDVLFNDGVKAKFGTDSDLLIYHNNGEPSVIEDAGELGLVLKTNGNLFAVTSDTNENMIIATPDGGVTLYHDNNIKLVVGENVVTIDENLSVSSGNNLNVLGGDLDVTGDITLTGTVDGVDIATLNSNAIVDGDFTTAGIMTTDGSGVYSVDSSTYATETYVDTAVSNLVDSAPATLDTLNELASALGDDANFSTTVTTSIGTKWTEDATKISNWDTAYSWDDHSTAGYLTAETNDLSTTVTWANVPDANITESSVTQHLTASNVSAAGALMDSEVTNLAQVKAFDSSDYATAAQGSTADSALQDLVDDTSPQLGGDLDLNGNDITGTGNISITQASTTVPALTLTSTDDGTVESPTMRLVRNSASQENADQIGQIEFYGKVGASAIREYAGIKAVLNDVSPSSHDGQLDFYTRKNSAETKLMSLTPTALELTNGTDLDVAGDTTVGGSVKTDFIEGSQYFNSNLNFYDTATQGGDGTTLSSTAGLSFKYDTNFNDDDGFKVFGNGNSTACFTINNSENVQATGSITADNGFFSTTGSLVTSSGNISASTGNITTVTGSIVTTGGNIQATSGNITAGGNISVTGTVDGRDVATDGARLDTIPYHRVKHTQLRADNQSYSLNTSYNNVGLYDTIVHPATPVECARYLELDIAIKWNYINSNTNDLYLQLQMTVPTGGGTVTNMGTATKESVNNPEYNGYYNFAWYYVSGDYTHLFTVFGRINTTGTSGSSEGLITAWKYDSVNNRTYLMTYDNPGVSFNTGDTFYYNPYAFESAGTLLTVTKDIDERYVSNGVQPHSFKFKTSYDDAALSYTLKMKEYTTADSGQVLGTTVTFTDVEEL